MLISMRKFAKAKSGLAAVEFALIAPVLVMLLLGTVELCDALRCHQKVTTLASTASDLVAQATSVSTSDISNIFDAMNAVLYPYSSSNAKIVISSILSDGKGGGTVDWSKEQNTTALTPGDPFTVPSGLMPQSECGKDACSIIVTQVTYDYTSPFGKIVVGTIPMSDTFYAHPRRSLSVTCTNC